MPAQTRGFLFSDLRDYSAYVERHGDRSARDLLAEYRRIVRDVIGRFGGAEIRTEGDSFYVVFASVSQAVEAGLAIQAGLASRAMGEPIRAGIGIHAGEVEDDAEHGIVSSAVNIAARICALARPGEVLVSEIVRGLTRSYLDVTYVPRGRRRLKGISESVMVYRVRADPMAVRPTRSIRSSRFVPAVVVVALAASGLLGLAMLPPAAEDGALDASEPAEPIGSSTPVASPTQPTASAAFPDAEQAANLRWIATERHDRCGPAAGEDGPRFRDVRGLPAGEQGTLSYLPTRGGVECRLGGVSAPDTMWVWTLAQFGSAHQGVAPTNAEEYIRSLAGQVNAATGTCTPESGPTLEEWSFSDRIGLLLCYETVTGDAVINWAYGHDDHVLARAVRDDRDMAALLEWWRSEARVRH